MNNNSGYLFDPAPFQSDEENNKPLSELDKVLNRFGEVEERLLRNLENRANRGEKLTAADYRTLQELRQRIENWQTDVLPDHVVKTAREVAEFFGRTIRTVRNWAGRGMPQLPDGYDLRAIDGWALKEGLIQESKFGTNPEPSGKDPNQEGVLNRAHYELEIKRLDSELKTLKLQKEREEVFQRDWIAGEWSRRMAEVSSGLEYLITRLPPLLEGRSQTEMRPIIRDEVWIIRDRYNRTGRFCPSEVTEESP
ncbi:MAG: hypothetical protein JRI94_04315 [Deltaproteobacteria bacterium]|nr:hypothetical protein [Deltaproteobacteria bacterium]